MVIRAVTAAFSQRPWPSPVTLTLLLQTVLKAVSRFEDPQFERVVDHARQGGAEEPGSVCRGQLTDVVPQTLEPRWVNRVIDGVKADAGKIIMLWLESVTCRLFVMNKRAVLHVTGVMAPG